MRCSILLTVDTELRIVWRGCESPRVADASKRVCHTAPSHLLPNLHVRDLRQGRLHNASVPQLLIGIHLHNALMVWDVVDSEEFGEGEGEIRWTVRFEIAVQLQALM